MKLKLKTIGFEINEDDLETYGYSYYNIYRMIFHCYDENKKYQKIEFDYLACDEFLEYFNLDNNKIPYKNNADGNVHWLTTYLKFNIEKDKINFYQHEITINDNETVEEEFILSIDLERFKNKLNEFRRVLQYLKIE